MRTWLPDRFGHDSHYAELRARLVALLSQPEKDMAEVDRLVDELESCQLALKGEMGVQGNNPNE